MKELKLIRSVENRAKWLLHELHSYEVIQGGQYLEEYQFKTSPDDKILGIYRNYPNSSQDLLIITNFGIYVGDKGKWNFLNYILMEKIEMSSNIADGNLIYLSIILENQTKFILPIKHGSLSYGEVIPDFWGFEKFISGIISGLKSKNAPK